MAASPAPRAERRMDIDWLRIIAVWLLIPYHTARIFDLWEPFYAQNAVPSAALSLGVIGFLGTWHMPLLFLLAGAANWYALNLRSGWQYIKERFLRLLIPFVFGLAVIVPPQTYYAMLKGGGAPIPYWQFYPRFWVVNPDDLGGYAGSFTPGHLWFIMFLFVFSLVALPIFLALRTNPGKRLIGWLAALCERPGVLFLAAIPLTIIEGFMEFGGLNPPWFLAIFIAGYVLMADPRLQVSIDRHKTWALILGIIALAATLGCAALGIEFPDDSLGDIVFSFGENFAMWFCLIALLGYGHRYLNVANRWWRYASEAAYPFYLLHQTVVVAIGYYVTRWQMGIAAKFVIICVAATALTLLIYDLVVRRVNVLRFLFGMKPLAKR